MNLEEAKKAVEKGAEKVEMTHKEAVKLINDPDVEFDNEEKVFNGKTKLIIRGVEPESKDEEVSLDTDTPESIQRQIESLESKEDSEDKKDEPAPPKDEEKASAKKPEAKSKKKSK